MRLERSIKNTFFGILKTVMQLVLKFIVRTIFIKILGEELLGLDSLFASILQVLSLAELGFGTVIIYSMYKPVSENDYNKIGGLLSLYRKIYLIVGLCVLAVGLILTPFLPYLIEGTPPKDVNIYVVFIIFLINSSVGYFLSYKRSLLYANQRNDIESKVALFSITALYSLQIVLLLLFRSYYAYIIMLPVFALLENIIITVLANKMYPNIKCNNSLSKSEKKEIAKNVGVMVGHKVGTVVVGTTDNVLISLFLGLSVLGIYNSYYLLVFSIISFLNVFINGMTASVGNSVVLESVEKNYETYKNISFIFFWLVSFCGICLFSLLNPFVEIWLGTQYLLDTLTVMVICTKFVILRTCSVFEIYLSTTGLVFKHKLKFKPYFEAGVNLVASLILVQFWGLIGILIGTILSTLLINLPFDCFYLYRNYFKKPQKKFYIFYILFLIVTIAIGALTWYVVNLLPNGIGYFVLKILICLIIPNAIFIAGTFWTPQFKYFKCLICSLFKKILKRKNKNVEKEEDPTDNADQNNKDV